MLRRKFSVIWQYFSSENENRVNCLICNQTLSFSNKSTYALIRHLDRKHPMHHSVFKNSFRVYKKSESHVSDKWLREAEKIPANTAPHKPITVDSVPSEMHRVNIDEETSVVQKLLHEKNVIDETVYVNDSEYTDDSVSQFAIFENSNKVQYDAASEFRTSEYIGPHNDRTVFQLPSSKSTQTEEDSEDRINCGFVNISKNGAEKYFYLRCFYCDAEYPIIFWSKFSEHILYNHGQLEEAYDKTSDVLESTINEQCFFDYSDTENDSEPENDFVTQNLDEGGKIQQNRCNSELIEISSENSDTLDASEQNDFVDSQNDLNASSKGDKPINDSPQDIRVCETEISGYVSGQGMSLPLQSPKTQKSVFAFTTTTIDDDSAPIDEICFGKTNHNIIIDFFHHLKDLPSLWFDRKIDSEKYDKELLNLMEKMNLKWSLKLRMDNLGKSLENIKAWFHKIKAEKERNLHLNNNQLNEYYEKCAELLAFESANNQRFSIPAANDQEEILLHKIITTKEAPPPPSQAPPQPSLHSEMVLDCCECKKKFACAKDYKAHVEIHPNGYRPYACQECGSRFKTNSKRNLHQRKHTAAGFQCDICSKKILNLFSLKIHMNVHKGIYPYFCEWCGRRYASRQHCKEHREYAHLGHGICKICNREYKQRSILQKHLKTLHRPIFGTNEELSKRSCRPQYLKQKIQRQTEYELKHCSNNNANNNNGIYDINFSAAAMQNNNVPHVCSAATNIVPTDTRCSVDTVRLTVNEIQNGKNSIEIPNNHDSPPTEKAYSSLDVKEEDFECGEYEFITNSRN